MDRVMFSVNGVEHSVGCEVSSTTTLLDYLRQNLEFRGTKYMCLEGGCGACIVSVIKQHGDVTQGVNSCMISITSCQNWEITTIDMIGNRLEGYHPLQIALARSNGSQCGYCSPGMVMNMYSFLKVKPRTMLEIEKSLGSNVCRCTGYRPILEAFKQFASDAPKPDEILDIEDLKICEKSGAVCWKSGCEPSDWCFVSKHDVRNEILHVELKDHRDWYRAETISDIFTVWKEKGIESYMLVAGNTGKGVYPILEYPKLLIDISSISELRSHYLDQNLVVGGGTTLADVIDIFETIGGNDADFKYLNVLNDHLRLVAHVTIRNSATLAGNLMLKNYHLDFKSDVFLLLETVGAELTILTDPDQKKTVSMQEFLRENMKGKIILNILLPPLSFENKLVTYKIMPRSQNAHALVHAGFLYKINESNVVIHSRIVYGALSPTFIRAYKTERYIAGKVLFTNETLQGAIEILKNELVVVESLPDPPVMNRRQIAMGLFYKGLLTLSPPSFIELRYQSGAIKLNESRPVSQSTRVYDTNPSLYPLNEPIPKIEGLIQCAGEAKYTEDVPSLPREVFCAFVLAKIGSGTIVSIDPSMALRTHGVIAFYSASDIPGPNSFIPAPNMYNLTNEELFCDGEVKYFDQPLGVVVAENQSIAEKAAVLVEVKYGNIKRPVIDIREAKRDPNRVMFFSSTDAKKTGNDIFKIIKGQNNIYAQYHFTMETLTCVAHPTEEGLRMYATTQWMDLVQQISARTLKIEENRVDVIVRRIGGGYGYKITRSAQVTTACSLVAYKLNRPCRFINSLTANMRATGKRLPCSRDYEVGVNVKGVIQYVHYEIYSDNGYIINEPLMGLTLDIYNNCYTNDPWHFTAYNTVTDTASNSWCRAPGTLEGVAMAEIMIERIAYELNLDPLQVRLDNLDMMNYGDLKELSQTIINNSQFAERKLAVDLFNTNNRWKKRGLRLSFLRWTPMGYQNFEVNLSVLVDDGSVVITHGGIEMGQGINTKAIQICAHFLNIPIDKIQVKPNDTVIAPNGTASGASITTQNIGIGVRRCCEKLLQRLEPIKSQMLNPTWEDLIKEAYNKQVDLQVHDYTTRNDEQHYDIFGVTLAEVEIDVLTGEWQILRVDLIEDVGQSVNPELDIGQVEGAFIMGVGYWTCENLVYEPNTGELLTNRTWEYWVPQASDIPQDFRIYFRKRSYSTEAILGAKATGEPPTCMSVAVTFAMRAAITAARLESGIPSTQWFEIDGPFTVDKICISCETKCEDFKFY